jgi:hypothetical protein
MSLRTSPRSRPARISPAITIGITHPSVNLCSAASLEAWHWNGNPRRRAALTAGGVQNSVLMLMLMLMLSSMTLSSSSSLGPDSSCARGGITAEIEAKLLATQTRGLIFT